MSKRFWNESWNKCNCGIITDLDEKKCPRQGLEDDSKHRLKPVKISNKELMGHINKGEVYTKDHSIFQDLLVQKAHRK